MIKTTDLHKTFDGIVALNQVNCEIPGRCIYGMVGSNGAGKSTFLRTITGIYRPDSGTVLLDEEPVYENPSAKAKIAFVPDELFFLPGANMNRMALQYAAVYKTFDRERYIYLTTSFGLDPKRALNTFSKGMRRQAAIILAIACRPQYLFFDETFDGLDPVMRKLVKSLICEDVLERGATAIITSHSLRELEDICDQLALLHQGGMILQSDVQHLKTSLFKIQAAFHLPFEEKDLAGIDLLHFTRTGSVVSLIARGDKNEAVARLQAMNPILLDVLPLSLEEVFTYEMEALGYSFAGVAGGLK